MHLNNKSLTEYGGILLAGYTVSGYEIDACTFKGKSRSSLNFLNASTGTKVLNIPIAFKGDDLTEASQKKSIFEGDAFGKNELVMDDGLLYSAVLSNIGKSTYVGTKVIKAEYEFIAIRHGEYKTIVGNTVHCDSTLPYTDCILTATVTADRSNYKLGTVTFKEVTAGEVLTVDGINGRILLNGVPAAERADWIEFPKLIPGINHISCDDALTVEFYPAYF